MLNITGFSFSLHTDAFNTFCLFPSSQQNNNNSTGSCESTQEGAGRQTKAITHRFTLCRNWHHSIHQAHKRGMEAARWQDTSLVLICCWMAPLSVFFTPLPPPFCSHYKQTGRGESCEREESNTTLNEKCSQSLNQKCPRRHQIWMQMNAAAAVPSFESDSTEQCAPGTVHHLAAVTQKDINLEKKKRWILCERREERWLLTPLCL